jgi:hypothetical protein
MRTFIHFQYPERHVFNKIEFESELEYALNTKLYLLTLS